MRRRRRRPRPTPRCGCPTSGRCSATTSPAGRPAPTSAPARSPSARWCRCARCRTGWSACSASTTASSRGSALVDGDDVLARAPGHRRARRPQRGPPAAARRDPAPRPRRWWSPTPAPTSTPASRGRPPYRSASCSTPSTAPPTPAGPRPASWSSTRCSRSTPATSTPGRLGAPAPFTFDPAALVAARAAAGDRPAAPRVPRRRRCRCRRPDDVALADLLAFFRDPVKGFFRALDVTLPWDVDGVADAMPVEIDDLETVGRRRPDAARPAARHPPRPGARATEWRRGVAAAGPARLAQRPARSASSAMQLAIARAHPPPGRARRRSTSTSTSAAAAGSPAPSPASTATGWSRSATPGSTASSCSTSWIRLLALAADDPDRNWTALTIGRPPRGTQPAAAAARPGRSTEPLALLADLVALYDAGRREPLPLPLKTSFAWARPGTTGDDPRRGRGVEVAARSATPARTPTPPTSRVWGPHAPLDGAARSRPGPARSGPASTPGSARSRPGVWEPMLRCEQGAP